MYAYFIIPFYDITTEGLLGDYGAFKSLQDSWIYFNDYWFFPTDRESTTFDGNYKYQKIDGKIQFGIFDEGLTQ